MDNSMTAPIIPPSALTDGETDMQVTGMPVYIHGRSQANISIFL